MPFNLQNGYQPRTFAELLAAMTAAVNTQFGTSYDVNTIVGTEFYKYFYAGIQEVMKAESETAQITAKMTDYIRTANDNIKLPKSTIDGFTDALFDELGLIATFKPITLDADAGTCRLAVDVDDGEHAKGSATITDYSYLTNGGGADIITINGVNFTAQTGAATLGTGTFQAATSNNATAISLATQINAHATVSLEVKAVAIGAIVNLTAVHGGVAGNSIALSYTNTAGSVGATVSGSTLTGGVDNPNYSSTKQEIIDRIGKYLTTGLKFYGTETGSRVAANGQSFEYKYFLPTFIDFKIKITVTISQNTKSPILNTNQIRDIFNAKFEELYKLGLNFEPEKYLEIERDLPFVSDILLEYSEDDGATWDSVPRIMAFDEKVNITAPAEIIIN